MSDRRTTIAIVAAAAAAAVAVGGGVGLATGGNPATAPDASPSPAGQLHSSRSDDTDARAGSPQHRSDDGESPAGTNRSPEAAGVESAPDPSSRPQSGAPSGAQSGPQSDPDTGESGPGGEDPILPGVSGRGADRGNDPVWTDPPTRAAVGRGRLAAGYPDALLPALPRAQILTTSVSPSPGRVQVALVARTERAADAVLRFYRGRLSAAGFTESDAESAGGARAAAFRRGGDRVVVTMDAGPGSTYSIYASLDAEAS